MVKQSIATYGIVPPFVHYANACRVAAVVTSKWFPHSSEICRYNENKWIMFCVNVFALPMKKSQRIVYAYTAKNAWVMRLG